MTSRASSRLLNYSAFRTSRRSVPFNRSVYPFTHAEPGQVWMVLISTRPSRSCKVSAMNAEPLLERRCFGLSRSNSKG